MPEAAADVKRRRGIAPAFRLTTWARQYTMAMLINVAMVIIVAT